MRRDIRGVDRLPGRRVGVEARSRKLESATPTMIPSPQRTESTGRVMRASSTTTPAFAGGRQRIRRAPDPRASEPHHREPAWAGASLCLRFPGVCHTMGAARALKGLATCSRRRLAWFIPFAIVTTGCVRGGGALFGFGVLAGAAVVASQPVVVESVEIVQPPPFGVRGRPVLSLPPPPPARQPFDATAAKVALRAARRRLVPRAGRAGRIRSRADDLCRSTGAVSQSHRGRACRLVAGGGGLPWRQDRRGEPSRHSFEGGDDVVGRGELRLRAVGQRCPIRPTGCVRRATRPVPLEWSAFSLRP